MKINRRKAVRNIGTGLAAYSLAGTLPLITSCNDSASNTEAAEATASTTTTTTPMFFKISLAQWSLHKSFFGPIIENGFEPFIQAMQTDPDSALQGELDPIDFPVIARQEFGIDTIELVNTFYFTKAKNMDYLKELKNRAAGEGVGISMIMCDFEGDLGDADAAKRQQTVENHYKWIEAVKFLGGNTIRVNAAGQGSAEEVKSRAAEGLAALAEYAQQENVNVLVENHGGYSSDGQWLASLMETVNLPNCGTLPDFGNFCIEGYPWDCKKQYDRYQGVKELTPFAKGISAKSHAFDENGNETNTDYTRMLKIVKDAGFTGNIGIEYEGTELPEKEGIMATKKLLERVAANMG